MEARFKIAKLGIAGAVAFVILVIAGLYAWKHLSTNQERDTILAALPGPPDGSDLEPIVASSIERAYQQIETGKDPLTSLGYLAKLYQANGLLNEAIQTLDLLLKLQPENPRWPHFLAFILAGYGELEVAIPLWDRTIEIEPDYMPTRLRKAEALLKLDRMEDAQDTFLRVLIKDPRNAIAHHGLARVAINKEDFLAAHGYLTKSMENSSGSVGIQLMVTVLDRLGRTNQANTLRGMARTLESYSDIPDQWIHELMDYCYDPYQLLSGGGFAVYAGDFERGIALMSRAIQYDPDNAMAHYQLGMAFQQDNQIERALASYEKASLLNPQLSDAWLKRAILYINAGHTKTGDELLAQGLANNPTSPALHLLTGERMLRKKLIRESIFALKRSIELRPQEPEAYTMLGRVYLEQGEFEKARDIVLDALKTESANPVALSMMVILNIALENENEARNWLKEVERQPRIHEKDRQDIIRFFENAFGHKPE